MQRRRLSFVMERIYEKSSHNKNAPQRMRTPQWGISPRSGVAAARKVSRAFETERMWELKKAAHFDLLLGRICENSSYNKNAPLWLRTPASINNMA